MPSPDSLDIFSDFFADGRVVELVERLKTSDDLLEIVKLRETQHSDLLAWMFSPREGHGQGDEILRDLLVSAYRNLCQENTSFDKRSKSAKFFDKWNLPKIRTTSFAGAFPIREFCTPNGGRLDLLIVDVANQFLITIENKAGAKLTPTQLKLYESEVAEISKSHPLLKNFDQLFIVLDKNQSEDSLSQSNKWIHLDYSWLENSAKRASYHIERGNAAATLIVSYCERQTDWESDADSMLTALASELVLDHEKAISHLVNLGNKPPIELMQDTRKSAEQNEQNLWLYVLQNRELIEKFRQVRGTTAIKHWFINHIPDLPADNIVALRSRVEICPRHSEDFNGDDWGCYLEIRLRKNSARAHNPDKQNYSLYLWWRPEAMNLPREKVDEIRINLARELELPDLEKKYVASLWRRILLEGNISQEELRHRTVKWENNVGQFFFTMNQSTGRNRNPL